MRVAEFKQREDFFPVLAQTLARGWSLRQGHPILVSFPARRGDQPWLLQPTLSACYVRDPSPRVRAFLRDSMCFSPRLRRLPFQLALGLGLASRWGLRLTANPCFSVAPALPRPRELLVVPGNLRVRIYDFAVGRCLVLQKQGFESDSMRREIEARTQARAPSLPLTASGDDSTWFEEPILDGYALPHLPPWLRRSRIESKLFPRLDAWAGPSIRSEPAAPWAEQRLLKIRALSARLPVSMVDLRAPLHSFGDALAEIAAQLPEVLVGPTHGDMQAGNVLVRRDGSDFSIIDWEHWGERFSSYDRLVYGLGARAGKVIIERARRFLHLAPGHMALAPLPADRAWRRAALAAFLLEDLLWFTEENLRGPFSKPSAGWALRLALKDSLLSLLQPSR